MTIVGLSAVLGRLYGATGAAIGFAAPVSTMVLTFFFLANRHYDDAPCDDPHGP